MHTTGHWKVYGSTQYAGFKVVDAKGRSIAAFPSTSTRPDAERTANARLIAAAPEMLTALIQLRSWFDRNPSAQIDDRYLVAVDAVLKKAREG